MSLIPLLSYQFKNAGTASVNGRSDARKIRVAKSAVLSTQAHHHIEKVGVTCRDVKTVVFLNSRYISRSNVVWVILLVSI